MKNNEKLLLLRLIEAEKIVGSLTKLSKLSNINYVQISRVKNYLKGNRTSEQARKSFSLKNLQKLADAINEDVSFFTDENYIKRKDRNNNIHIKDKELKPLLEDFITIFNNASIKDQGFLQGKLEQLINEFYELSTQRDNQINNTIKKTL